MTLPAGQGSPRRAVRTQRAALFVVALVGVGIAAGAWMWLRARPEAPPFAGSERTRLPADITDFVAQADTPGESCAAAARRGARAAQALFDAANGVHSWPIETPSVTSHLLLACGRDCPSPYNPDGLLDDWFLGALAEDEAPMLHRGELLALAAELRLRPDKPIMWRSRDVSSVGELLDDTARNFSVPPQQAWDQRELDKGPSYGWELQGFCNYLGPSGELNAQLSVEQAAAAVAAVGPNTQTEAGTHDLEGLALCLAEYRLSDAPSPAAAPAYAEVAALLEQRLNEDLARMSEAGQLYADDASFDDCSSEDDPSCLAWAQLLRQAHFIEWSTLHAPACSPAYALALTRFAELSERSLVGVPEAKRWSLALLLLASTHAVHAARRLAWRYGESGLALDSESAP